MKRATLPSFDRVASVYRWAEYLALGRQLERTREHFLPQLANCRQALVLGDGDGRFLARLLQTDPSLHALAVDTSASMLRLLRQRCNPYADRVQTLQTSALTVTAPAQTDLIVTHFFLDCFTQPEVNALTQRLSATLATGALWLVSDFEIPPSRILRRFAAAYIRALYLAFRMLTGLRVTKLPNPQAALLCADFELLTRHERLWGMLYTELWQRR